MSQTTPADPLAKGILATARQSWKDLFIWKQRVVVSNKDGETACEWKTPDPIRNPINLLCELTAHDWLFFAVGFFAWTASAFDFHALSIQTVKLADYYGKSNTDITTAITLTLLLRSIGAAAFGLAGDKWGRKWPMVLNLLIIGVLQIGTIYCKTYGQFLGVRCLFGLFMGGIYGNAMTMALEQCPTNARGLISGILQQGYSFGYVLAACVNLGVGGGTDTWTTAFWVGAAFPIVVGIIRVFFPESQLFLEAKARGHKATTVGEFWHQTIAMLGRDWRMCVYCIILMTWFNCFSHTSQDSYTTFLLTEKELANAPATRASILMKTGACVGGTIIGYLSQFLGRRRAIVGAAILAGAMIPAWILPQGERALSVTGFFMQFFVQGAWGVVPIHLNELSPPDFRASFAGVTYQLGNMISSPATEIVNAVSEKIKMSSVSGDRVDAYGPVMGVATAIIILGIVVSTIFGPERRGRALGVASEDKPAAIPKTLDEERGEGMEVEEKSK